MSNLKKKQQEILDRAETRIRKDYSGILSEAQIQATIDWWQQFLSDAMKEIADCVLDGVVDQIRSYRLTSYTVDGQAGEMEKEILHNVNEKVDEIAFEINKQKQEIRKGLK